mmetsp:Transcript_16518/g.31399  ORF Transcript_16518/g.31399 Transcript_16518/m.31399 type:complete len:683 (+) Transcript_16518:145-2193(+)
MRGLRTLQTATCFINEVAFYPFNYNDDVTAFHGIMFNLKGQGGFVEVLALELDVRLKADTDLAVEVYSYNGDYSSVHGDPGAWDLLADSYMVLYPDSSGGAVIPSHDFRPFTLGDGETKSLYIKMKGPWIDNSLNAFLDEGEAVPNENEQLVIYPGAGLFEDFATSYDASYLPIFAGNFHLRTQGACAEVPETNVKYLIVTDNAVTDTMLANIAEAVDMTMETIFRVDTNLVGFQNDYDVKQVDKSVSVEVSYELDKCRWERCSSIETTVSWTHSDELDVNEFLYRMYTHTKMVADEIQYILPDGSLVRYIGKEATKAEFQFILKDVKGGRGMDQSQEDYFVKHTLDFINSKADDFSIEALTVEIDEKFFVSSFGEEEDEDGDEESDGNGGGRRLQEVGQLELKGRILGTRYSYMSEAEFALQIQDLYYNPGKVRDYVLKMAFEVNFPGPMSEFNRHEFFDDLVMIDGKVEVKLGEEVPLTQAPTDSPEGADEEKLKKFVNRTIDSVASWKPIAWILIGISIFLIFVAIASFLVVRCVKEQIESKKRKEERMVDKEFMRQEKRLDEIRRRKMMQQGIDGASVGLDPADQSFCNESFAESYMEDSMVFDGQGSMMCSAVLPGAAPIGPPGSRRRFYGPALANMGNEGVEQPRRMPPSRNISGDSSVLSAYSGGGQRGIPPGMR